MLAAQVAISHYVVECLLASSPSSAIQAHPFVFLARLLPSAPQPPIVKEKATPENYIPQSAWIAFTHSTFVTAGYKLIQIAD